MSLKKITPQDVAKLNQGELLVAIDNGDLKVLQEIVEKWKFVDAESALRFAIGILFLSKEDKRIRVSKEGVDTNIVPAQSLLKSTPPNPSPVLQMVKQSRPEEDFNINDIVRTDDHQKLLTRVQELEKTEYFVATFCRVSKEYVNVQQCINEVIVKLIQKDDQCRTEIRKIIEYNDKRTFKSLLFKLAGWVGYAASFLLGLITTALVNKFLNPSPH